MAKGGKKMTVRETARAKINLCLNVGGKRTDGFHDIETVMQTVSLSDTLTVELDECAPDGIDLRIIGDDALAPDEDNLVLRAARAFLRHSPIKGKISITLEKKIPISAGLAGGSADAAATFRALNRLSTEPLTAVELSDLAASLGSDVPFCLVGGTALCKGRGEIVESMDFCDLPHLLIVKTNESVSTPKAFAALDAFRSQSEKIQPFDSEKVQSESEKTHYEGERIQSKLDFYRTVVKPTAARGESHLGSKIKSFSDSKNESTNNEKSESLSNRKSESIREPKNVIPIELYNVFEDVIFPICPAALSVKKRLLELSARHALMSGSGPTVFAVFDSEAQLNFAKEILYAENPEIQVFTANTTKK